MSQTGKEGDYQLYKDIEKRTKGEIYVGVVGPVRTGKSTFIRRFMEIIALPQMDPDVAGEMKDQLPVSGSGKQITTVEPKFIPKEACEITLGDEVKVNLRLIDCVGYLVKDAVGNLNEHKERLVKTPWFSQEIPFEQAAEYGTRRVIFDHATIGLVITSDGSFGEIPREQFAEPEERTIQELKKLNKPFLVLVNSRYPFSEETTLLVKQIQEKQQVMALSVNCEQLRKEDINRIFEKILYEFPIRQMEFYIPKWLELLPCNHVIKQEILDEIKKNMNDCRVIRHMYRKSFHLDSQYVKECLLQEIAMDSGVVKIAVHLKEEYYYNTLTELTGVPIKNEYDMIRIIRQLAGNRREYEKVLHAMDMVRAAGYSVVVPEKNEIAIEEPTLIRQGGKFGVKIRAHSPSIHMIKANIETEIAPIVGTEQQANDLIGYIKESGHTSDGIWNTNIFGKSIEQLVEDGIQAKIAQISEESQSKLQDTMMKIVNDSKGGMVCIII